MARGLPDVRFILAGNGFVEINGSNIQKIGFVSRRLLQSIIKKVEFVVSSSVCTETFGLSNGEEIKLGTLVVTTKFGAFPETVINGMNGRSVDASNVRQLTEVIKNLLNDADEVNRLRIGCADSRLVELNSYMERMMETYGA